MENIPLDLQYSVDHDPISIMTRIFSEVLQVADVRADDNFFMLGGNSIDLIGAVARARGAGMDITFREALAQPTATGLAAVARDARARYVDERIMREVLIGSQDAARHLHIILTSGEDLPLIGTLARHSAARDVLIHVLVPAWHPDEPYASADRLAGAFAQSMQASPPAAGYVIIGHCSAGAVAARVARRLQDLGRRIERLVLLDPCLPGPQTRCWRLEDQLPEDLPGGPDLGRLRQRMASISKRRAAGALSALSVMKKTWNAVAADMRPLATLIAGPAAAHFDEAALQEVAFDYLGYLSNVVGLEDPITCRLDPGTRVEVVITADAPKGGPSDPGAAWGAAIGGEVDVVRAPEDHQMLLSSVFLIGYLP